MQIVAEIMLYIQMSVVIVCLSYGAIKDIFKREVNDIPWLIMAIVGLITSIIFIIFSDDPTEAGLATGINITLGIILGALIYYTGMMGGADAKAIMSLGFNTPIYFFNFNITNTVLYKVLTPVFSTFFNWLVLIIIVYPIPLLLYNIFLRLRGIELFSHTSGSFFDKLIMLFSGYLIKSDKAKDRLDIVYSEVFDEEKGHWKIKHFLKVEEVEEEEKFKREVEERIKETDKKYIWVKVLPPGIVFLLIGYIINLLIGNMFIALLLATH